MDHDSEVDHYRALGVARDASTHEIRRAYRRLARRHHPDHNPHPGNSERFIALARAYAILNDPVQRLHYDQTLLAGSRPDRRPITPRAGANHPAVRHWTPRAGANHPAVRHGILELSPSEARRLARHPLTLTDIHGQAILLPAGAGPGDAIGLLYDNARVVLTIQVQRNT